MIAAKNIIHSFSHLFFPQNCQGCGSDLVSGNQVLCLQCLDQIPFTDFENHKNNPLEKIFWGRVSIEKAMSLFYFTKDSMMQNLMHQFKYRGKKELGIYFGEMMGKSIIKSDRFLDIEVLVPLPLFPSKEKRRGYNQSNVLCEGMAKHLRLPILNKSIIRTMATETQTHKNRMERWKNIEGKFKVTDPISLKNKHILLVDDVATTGATLEACANELLQIENVKLSIATLAIASF